MLHQISTRLKSLSSFLLISRYCEGFSCSVHRPDHREARRNRYPCRVISCRQTQMQDIGSSWPWPLRKRGCLSPWSLSSSDIRYSASLSVRRVIGERQAAVAGNTASLSTTSVGSRHLYFLLLPLCSSPFSLEHLRSEIIFTILKI
jgi:hypothetical protein